MDSWEFNKIAGAVLGTLLFGMGLGVLAEIIFAEQPPAEPGYRIEVAGLETPEGEGAPKEEPFAVLLAQGSAESGQSAARVCSACHTFDEGGASGVGPNLYGIVGAPVLHDEGFSYSSAFQSFGADKKWTYDELDHFLENPQGYIPGTKMSFAGIKDAQRRADVILYLRSISPDAPPLPEPPAETASAPTDTATDAADGADGTGDEQAAAGDAAGDATAATGDTAAATGATAAAGDAASTGDSATPDGGGGFARLVAAADPSQGERDARVCVACHSFDEGGPNKVGPNLYGIVGAAVLHKQDFNYSPAMRKFAEEHPTWTVDLLDQYLEAPMQLVPGTRMAFPGVKDENKRAAIVAYLRSVSPDAPPLEDARAPAADGEETRHAAAAPPGGETASDATASGDAAATDETTAAAGGEETASGAGAATAATATAAGGDSAGGDSAGGDAQPGAQQQASAAPAAGEPAPAGDAASTEAPAATAEAPAEGGTAADTPRQPGVTAAPGADAQAAAEATAQASAAAEDAGEGGASVAVIAPGGQAEVAVAPSPTDPGAAAEATGAGDAPAATSGASGDGEAPAQVAAAGDTGGAAGAAADPFVQAVAAADPAAGERDARVCVACHSFEKGGPRKVGPNLWDIVGGKVLKSEDFAYSPAMQKFAEEHPEWTIGLLDEYLAAPMKMVPGTKMAFAGIRDEAKRAAVVAYLRSLSDDPVPLPGAQ